MKKILLVFLVSLVFSNLFVSAIPLASAQSYSFADLGLGWASDINNAGVVAGSTYRTLEAGNSKATTWTDGVKNELILWFPQGTLENITNANAINEHGVVFGSSGDAPRQATVWHDSIPTGIPWTDTDWKQTSGSDINDLSQAVGTSFTRPDGLQRAVLWQLGSTTYLEALGDGGSFATGINNAGMIVGESEVSGIRHAVLWNDLTPIDLGLGSAFDINELGQIAGTDGHHAVIWNDGTPTILGDGGAVGINNLGQVVGGSEVIGPTLWSNGTAYALNSFLDAQTASLWRITAASDINDSGWIVGTATSLIDGRGHAFVMTPLPEPEIYAMMVIGLGVLGLVGRRRRKLVSSSNNRH